jgi:hypothetical protein
MSQAGSGRRESLRLSLAEEEMTPAWGTRAQRGVTNSATCSTPTWRPQEESWIDGIQKVNRDVNNTALQPESEA